MYLLMENHNNLNNELQYQIVVTRLWKLEDLHHEDMLSYQDWRSKQHAIDMLDYVEQNNLFDLRKKYEKIIGDEWYKVSDEWFSNYNMNMEDEINTLSEIRSKLYKNLNVKPSWGIEWDRKWLQRNFENKMKSMMV